MDGDTHATLKAMEATTTTSAVDEAGAFSAFSASKRAVRSLKLKEKEQQQIDFIETCTIADALVDEAQPMTVKGCKDTTPLRSIKGVCISLLGVKVLRSFVTKNKIQCKNKSKLEMCALIVERKKNEHLDQTMHSEDFEGDKSHDDSDEGEEEDVTADVTGVKKLKRLSKGSKPRELSEDGSLCRLILVCFLQELRPCVNQLGTNPLAVQLGTGGFLHDATFNRLASVCNDSARVELMSFDVNHDIHAASGIQKEAPSTFDKLSALALSQGIDFIDKHHREARRWQTQSGNHKPFDACCSSRPCLLLYHNCLQECGDPVLSCLAIPKLPDGVKRSSMEKKMGKTPAAAAVEKQKRSRALFDGLLEVSYMWFSFLAIFLCLH